MYSSEVDDGMQLLFHINPTTTTSVVLSKTKPQLHPKYTSVFAVAKTPRHAQSTSFSVKNSNTILVYL